MVIASEFSVNGNFRLTKFSVHSYDGGMSLPAIGAPQDLFDLVHECRQALEDGKLREAIAWAAEATLPLGPTSPLKGVCWYARVRKWYAQISVGGKNLSLGYFATEAEAHEAYAAAAQCHFGGFARLS